MAKARQQYFADEVTLQKENRDFAIQPELVEKLESIEAGAQVNVIETVKVNGEALTPDENKAVDVSVPLVEDTLYSTDPDKALSANQGKVLYEYIQNLASRGRYLSNWNADTGLPTTNPVDNLYQYRAGDYYIVSNVAALGGTNYRPDGSSYSRNVASTTVETETVRVGDYYTYDGEQWLLLVNTEREIAIDNSLSASSINPVENRVVTNALNTKQDNIADLETIRSGAALGATALQPGDSLSELSGTSDDITQGATNLFMTTAERSKLSNQSGVNTGDETQTTIKNKLGQASASTDGYLTSTDWNTFNNKQGAISDLGTIRSNAEAGKDASDTIATYGDIVTHDVNEFATAAQGGKADTALQPGDNVSELTNDVGYVTDAYHDDTKQDKLIAGTNIQISSDGKTISATDTTYVAGDFDIKDLADSTGLRTEWSGKQDELIAGNNIQIAADGKTISATDTTYTAGPGISISNNNVISNIQTSAEWGDITGTLSDQTDLQSALDNKQDTLTAGDNIQIAQDGTISATDTTYTAGTGISIDANNVISNTQTSAEWGNITGTLSDQADLQSALDDKQDILIAGDNITIEQVGVFESDMKGPCPSGFHVPSKAEWTNISNVLKTTLGLSASTARKHTKMPLAGRRQSDGTTSSQGSSGFYWASEDYNGGQAYVLYASDLSTGFISDRASGCSIRALKNTAVAPTSSWTTIYDGSAVAAGAGIFHNATDGLISISGDGTTWYTIADKNVGAAVVWNYGDSLTQANCGNYFQWGNNYGFPWTGTLTDKSSTQVDASTYGPGNYYSSSTFITVGSSPYRWDNPNNPNLRGGNTQGTWSDGYDTVISATDTTYQAGDFDIKDLADSTNLRSTWSGKQDVISDLSTIRNNASTALQPNDNVSELTNDAGYITSADIPALDTAMSSTSTNGVQNKVIKDYVDTQISEATAGAVSDTAYASSWDGITAVAPSKNAVYDKISSMDSTIAGKQDTINDLSTIRSGAALGTTSIQPNDNVSELTNDAGYITNAVSDLTNYYTKSETYTKSEVADYVANFAGFKVVSTLPTTDIKTTVIYLLGPVGTGADKYEEYIYSNNNWVMIGETSVDLTNYFNTSTDNSDSITEGSTNLFLTSAERTKLSNTSGTNTGDETKTTIQAKLGAASSNNSGYLTSTDWDTFNGKQDTLTAGDNITINGTTISATDTTYTAGTGIDITSNTISNSGVTSVNGSTGDVTVQPTLVSGTNIKTINGTSVLGTGDITISGGSTIQITTPTGYEVLPSSKESDGVFYLLKKE